MVASKRIQGQDIAYGNSMDNAEALQGFAYPISPDLVSHRKIDHP